jgi:cytoplasmic iron level regulating protein YaaA (DUF328/UPF0246 family)
MLVIISCVNSKENSARPAHKLYKGQYFKMSLAYALTLTDATNIRILSSKYGLLPLDKIINPYQLRITEPDAISDAVLKQQAVEQGLLNEGNVIVLAGKNYADKILKIWGHAQLPLKGVGGYGHQISFMKKKVKNTN